MALSGQVIQSPPAGEVTETQHQLSRPVPKASSTARKAPRKLRRADPTAVQRGPGTTADELEQLGPALAASTLEAKEAAGGGRVPVTELEKAEEQAELQLALQVSARTSHVREQLEGSTRLQEHLDTTFALTQSSVGDFADEVAQILNRRYIVGSYLWTRFVAPLSVARCFPAVAAACYGG